MAERIISHVTIATRATMATTIRIIFTNAPNNLEMAECAPNSHAIQIGINRSLSQN